MSVEKIRETLNEQKLSGAQRMWRATRSLRVFNLKTLLLGAPILAALIGFTWRYQTEQYKKEARRAARLHEKAEANLLKKQKQIRYLHQKSLAERISTYVKFSADKERIERIEFLGKHITDEVFEDIKDLDSIEWVSICNTSLTDRALDYLKPSQSIRSLCIDLTPVTDDGIRSIRRLRSLEELAFWRTNIEGHSFSVLVDLPHLRELDLQLNPSVDPLKSITGLVKLTQLKKLTLTASNFSDSEVNQLKQRLPNTDIVDE